MEEGEEVTQGIVAKADAQLTAVVARYVVTVPAGSSSPNTTPHRLHPHRGCAYAVLPAQGHQRTQEHHPEGADAQGARVMA